MPCTHGLGTGEQEKQKAFNCLVLTRLRQENRRNRRALITLVYTSLEQENKKMPINFSSCSYCSTVLNFRSPVIKLSFSCLKKSLLFMWIIDPGFLHDSEFVSTIVDQKTIIDTARYKVIYYLGFVSKRKFSYCLKF